MESNKIALERNPSGPSSVLHSESQYLTADTQGNDPPLIPCRLQDLPSEVELKFLEYKRAIGEMRERFVRHS